MVRVFHILLTSLTIVACLQPVLSAGQRPNIVFLLADDMNRDTWGVYGNKDCKTPNIDRLTKDGMTFNRAYCSVAMCAPFRQELYSGRSPWRTRTLANHSKSTADTKSIPHYLKPLGYRVALTGKTHIGPSEAYPFEILGDKNGHTNKGFVAAASQFFDDCNKADTPFCLFIASHDGHAPFTTGDPSQYDKDDLSIPPYWLDTPVLRKKLVQYYAEVSNFDKLVGQIRAALEQRSLWDNTLFVVCSEQGIQFPFAKWTCYDNGLHTGLVMSWPGTIKAGSHADELISIADITPTLVDAAGGELKAGDVDGKSFLKTLQGEQQVLHEYVYGAFTNCNLINNRDRIFPVRSIRSKDFALIYNPNHEEITSNVTLSGKGSAATSWQALQGSSEKADRLIRKLNHRPEFEFYHLAEDPHELNNAINQPKYESIIAGMKKALFEKLEALGDPDPIATERSLVKGGKKKNPTTNHHQPQP